MVIYDEKVKERLENGSETPTEYYHAMICEAAAKALGEVTVFYSAQPQGVLPPAVFVRAESVSAAKRLGGTELVTMKLALRYLAQNPESDAESEAAAESMINALNGLCLRISEIKGERTKTGAMVTMKLCFEQKNAEKDSDGTMRFLYLESN